jgi:hypothetical protein
MSSSSAYLKKHQLLNKTNHFSTRTYFLPHSSFHTAHSPSSKDTLKMSARSQCHLWRYEGGFLNLVLFARWSRTAEPAIYFRVVNNYTIECNSLMFAEERPSSSVMSCRFPRLQVATACFSCSPPDLNFLDPYFIFM